MKTKIKPADTAFSKCVRERANWTCEACGKVYEENSQGLHCSHFFSRRHRTIRWCGDNAAAHCFSCHQRLGGDPITFNAWIESHIGHGMVEILVEKMNSGIKVSKLEEKEIAKHYREQLKIMQEKRNAGHTGRIEFTSYQ